MKIKWLPKGSRTSPYADIGSFIVCCHKIESLTRKPRWFARIMSYGLDRVEFGPQRLSLAKAKQDAKRIVGEILLDYKAGLDKEVQNYRRILDV